MKFISLIPRVIVATGCLAFSISPAMADPKGKGKEKGGSSGQSQKADKGNKGKDIVRFQDSERGVIMGYFEGYRNQGQGLPPGLAKKVNRGKPLPPGWQKKVAPGYRIDDEWWPQFTPVPYDWFPGLRAEPDTRLYYHGDRVVRVYEPRREVVDVVIIR
jgi:hypothetical protein